MKLHENNKIKDLEKGQSMVELAVSLIILLILISGIVDLGRVAFYYIAMRDSAQEGASYGSIFPHNCSEIEERVKAGSVDSSRVQVIISINNVTCSDDCSSTNVNNGDIVKVTVKDPDFPITMPFLGVFIGKQSISLETTIQDQVVRVPKCDN